MRTRTIIFVFGLAVCVMGGCAPAGFRFPRWNDTAKLQPVNPPLPSISPPSIETTPSPALLALIREQDIQDENLFAPVALPASDSQSQPAKNPEPTEHLVAQTKVQDEPPNILQKAPGPRADDTLLDLLQKDLD